MNHSISTSLASSETIAAVRPNPWHVIGKRFERTSDPTHARARSGLDWTVTKTGLRTDDLQPVPDHFAIRRDDTHRVLGVVGRDYLPLQNDKIFEFFADLAGERRMEFETAGTFQQGRIVWVQAHLPDLDIRLGEDQSKTYLLIANGHVGNRPLSIIPTTIRVVCRNTLAMAGHEADLRRRLGMGLSAGFKVRHTSGMLAALADIRDAYAETLRSHKVTVAAWQHLASVPLTSGLQQQFLNQTFPRVGPDEGERARAMRREREAKIQQVLASPTSQVPGTRDTAFSLLQAVVEYLDHDRPTRTEADQGEQEQRLLSATFGNGATVKARAWSTILALTHA